MSTLICSWNSINTQDNGTGDQGNFRDKVDTDWSVQVLYTEQVAEYDHVYSKVEAFETVFGWMTNLHSGYFEPMLILLYKLMGIRIILMILRVTNDKIDLFLNFCKGRNSVKIVTATLGQTIPNIFINGSRCHVIAVIYT